MASMRERQPPANGNGTKLPAVQDPVSSPSHHPPAPPPLAVGAAVPSQQSPAVMQILSMGRERNREADARAHHPTAESLVQLGKASELTWIQLGQVAESLGDVGRAHTCYESALRHNAYSVVALSQIAGICRAKEDFAKAAEYFERVLAIVPDNGEGWGALGHCYLMIDDLKAAYNSYQQAIYYMANPQEPKLWYGIGILYDRYGSLEHAEEAFASVIRMNPDFEKANEIFFRLGIIYKQQRKSELSLECFRYVLRDPPYPLLETDVLFQIGQAYEQIKQFDNAKQTYEQVLAVNPTHSKVLQQLGGLHSWNICPFYEPETAIFLLSKSLASDANDAFTWYLLGRSYMSASNFPKAYESYQQAVYRDGKNPAFWCSIGVLYYNINQYHDALDAYSRAIRINAHLPEVWFNLGALYEACNDQLTDAVDAYQRTLQLDPNDQIVKSRLREIREHQASGAAISSPPPPKDLTPSSTYWNFSAYSPTPDNPGPDTSSPVNNARRGSSPGGSRFSPRFSSIDAGDGRRRSGPGDAMVTSPNADLSPRSSHRSSGPPQSILPQLKGLHGDKSRDKGRDKTPPAPSGSKLPIPARGSPPSPRSRDSREPLSHLPDGFHPYQGGPPPHHLMPRGPERPMDVDWDARNGHGERFPSMMGRRTPPLSNQPYRRDGHPYPPPFPGGHYMGPPPSFGDRGPTPPGLAYPRRPPFDDRERGPDYERANGRPGSAYPPYSSGYAGPSHDGSPFSEMSGGFPLRPVTGERPRSNLDRPRSSVGSRDGRPPSELSHRSSFEKRKDDQTNGTSKPKKPAAPPSHHEDEDRSAPPQSAPPTAPDTPSSKPGRGKKADEPKDASKKPRKRAGKDGPSKGDKKARDAGSDSESLFVTLRLPKMKTSAPPKQDAAPLSPASTSSRASGKAPARQLDEDYDADEGAVDALMGFAAAASAASFAAPVTSTLTTAATSVDSQSPRSSARSPPADNPRKRSLESPEALKRAKRGKSAGLEDAAMRDATPAPPPVPPLSPREKIIVEDYD